MLVVLMYHRISHTHSGLMDEKKASHQFKQHLTYLSKHYPIVVPGDRLTKARINICLSFDDAYVDFYHTVFPILQDLKVRALLAIPSGLILQKANKPITKRLKVPYHEALASYRTHDTLCSWEEIRTMLSSKFLFPASHGLTHIPIAMNNIEQEVIHAKYLLEEKTGQNINTFVYPYGRMKRDVHAVVKQHYRYSMRIGSAMNYNWDNCHQVLYRINADEFWTKEKPMLTYRHQLNLGFRFLNNSLRFK